MMDAECCVPVGPQGVTVPPALKPAYCLILLGR